MATSPKERLIVALLLETVSGSRNQAAGCDFAAIALRRLPVRSRLWVHYLCIAAGTRRHSVTLDACRSREELSQ